MKQAITSMICQTSTSTLTRSNTTDHVRYAYFQSVESAGADWAQLAERTGDLFFQAEFLSTVERNPPKGLRLGYVVVYKDNNPAGIIVCQIKRFSASESIAEQQEQDPCFFNKLGQWFKRRVSGWVDADILICGNLLVTGAHGYWFAPEQVSVQDLPLCLHEGIQFATQEAERHGTKIAVVLIKDVKPEEASSTGQLLESHSFTTFEVQPNMVLELPFSSFDAYLSAMSTKYRTRAKRAFKKGEALQVRELSHLEVLQASNHMYELYQQVATNAGFNMVDLNEHYMPDLHKAMNGKFRVFGYFLEGKMVSYCTTLLNDKEMEAHFIGYEKPINQEYQLYLNMLYKMVSVALESGCCRIVFARTALEIKSTVGAEPHPLLCYLRHQNQLLNKLTGTLLDYLKPVEVWQQRRPFKAQEEQLSTDEVAA